MRKSQKESYEIYKNHPEEAFTYSLIDEEIKEALLMDESVLDEYIQYSSEVRIRRLLINNKVSGKPAVSRRKNKWRKKKQRWIDYARNNWLWANRYIGHAHYKPYEAAKVGEFLRKVLPAGVIQKESTSNIYILCPFHQENTASMCLGKVAGIAKCFGCGKAKNITTLLSMTLWNSRSYWNKQLENYINPPDPAADKQGKLPFPE